MGLIDIEVTASVTLECSCGKREEFQIHSSLNTSRRSLTLTLANKAEEQGWEKVEMLSYGELGGWCSEACRERDSYG